MDNGDRPDNEGEGRRKERFGSGREVEELEVGFREQKGDCHKRGREMESGAYPKVLGAPPAYSRTVGRGQPRHTHFPRGF